jgi:hypothetical protein
MGLAIGASKLGQCEHLLSLLLVHGQMGLWNYTNRKQQLSNCGLWLMCCFAYTFRYYPFSLLL